MTDTEKDALERRIDELCAEVEAERQRNAKLFEAAKKWMAKAAHFEAENAKLHKCLQDLVEHIREDDTFGLYYDWILNHMHELGIEVPS